METKDIMYALILNDVKNVAKAAGKILGHATALAAIGSLPLLNYRIWVKTGK